VTDATECPVFPYAPAGAALRSKSTSPPGMRTKLEKILIKKRGREKNLIRRPILALPQQEKGRNIENHCEVGRNIVQEAHFCITSAGTGR